MAKVLMTARTSFQRGSKILMPGDTFAADSIGDAKKLMRQNLARPKSVVAQLNRAMASQTQPSPATGKYRAK